MNIHQTYQDLLSLTKSLILNEFNEINCVTTDLETYNFFKPVHSLTSDSKKTIIQPSFSNITPSSHRLQPPVLRQSKPTSPPLIQNNLPKNPPLSKNEENLSASVYSKQKHQEQILKLEPLTNDKHLDTTSLKIELRNLFPNLAITDFIPDDIEAKKIKQQWKQVAPTPEVIVLTFDETPEQKEFLQKVTNAITQKLVPATLLSAYTIDKQNKWENMFHMKGIKLIISSDFGIYSFPNLMRYYREFQKTLGGIPVLLLTDLSLYLTQPHLKAALWQTLRTMLEKK